MRHRKRKVQLTLSTGLAGVSGLISWFATAQVVSDLAFPYLSLILFACLTGIGIAAVLFSPKESQELH
ncbi:hypothetical protein JCM19045_4076 [Bacillus sp. JCM 19045]|nr:hypothetical protein JCM19045_4076 [Bacillus sp. JCM 19045]